jgi:hypothetical protein
MAQLVVGHCMRYGGIIKSDGYGKKIKKLLDKIFKVCYNKYIIKKRKWLSRGT